MEAVVADRAARKYGRAGKNAGSPSSKEKEASLYTQLRHDEDANIRMETQ
jgi:hypothetical protein